MPNRWLVLTGTSLVFVGLILILLGFVVRFRLPGDILIQRHNLVIFLPITSSILLSLILSGLLWLILRLFAKQ